MIPSHKFCGLLQASTDCIVWAMDRGTFRSILMTSTNEKRQLYEEFLENVPLLQVLRKPIYSSNKNYFLKDPCICFPFELWVIIIMMPTCLIVLSHTHCEYLSFMFFFVIRSPHTPSCHGEFLASLNGT